MYSKVMRAAHLQPQQTSTRIDTFAGCQLAACTSCGRSVVGCRRMFLQAVLGSASGFLLSAGVQHLFSFCGSRCSLRSRRQCNGPCWGDWILDMLCQRAHAPGAHQRSAGCAVCSFKRTNLSELQQGQVLACLTENHAGLPQLVWLEMPCRKVTAPSRLMSFLIVRPEHL